MRSHSLIVTLSDRQRLDFIKLGAHYTTLYNQLLSCSYSLLKTDLRLIGTHYTNARHLCPVISAPPQLRPDIVPSRLCSQLLCALIGGIVLQSSHSGPTGLWQHTLYNCCVRFIFLIGPTRDLQQKIALCIGMILYNKLLWLVLSWLYVQLTTDCCVVCAWLYTTPNSRQECQKMMVNDNVKMTWHCYMYISSIFSPWFAVTVNCHFCNRDTQVPYGNQNCWDCLYCDQYNGFAQVCLSPTVHNNVNSIWV